MTVDQMNLIRFAFESNNKQFIIPVYQRNYDWGIDNCSVLFDDVLSSIHQNHSHFLGTFVQCAESRSTQGVSSYIIIDGQQRLTTIYLFLKALQDACNVDDERHRKQIQNMLFNDSSCLRIEDEVKYKLKLKAVKTDQEQLELLMSNRYDEIDKKTTIWTNYSYFEKAIKNEIKNNNLTIGDFLNGLDLLEIVVITLKEPNDDPQVVFERINSTGVDLQLSDLIRNYLLMTASDMDFLFDTYWSPMEEEVGKDQVNDYIFTYLIFIMSDITDKNAYKSFKKYVAQNNLSHEDILKDIKKYAKYYALFIGQKSFEYSDAVVDIMENFRLVKNTTIYPLLFSIFSDFDDGIIDETILLKLLNFLLTYLVRRTIVGIPTNSMRGLFRSLYARIFPEGPLTGEQYLKAFYDTFIMLTRTSRDGIQSDASVLNALTNSDLYAGSKSYFCKFLLATLENNTGNKNEKVKIDETITIEHILPQTPSLWWDEETKDTPNIRSTHLHKLGNLSLTGVNSKLSNDSFDVKKKSYNITKYSYLYSDVVDKDHWSADAIDARGERLANRLVEIFSLPEYVASEFNGKNFKENSIGSEHSLAEQFDYTSKKPDSIVFCGASCPVKYMKDILSAVCSQLYEDNPNDFENMVSIANFNSTSTPVFSFNPSDLRSAQELEETGIYFETNYSANRIIDVVRKLLTYFGIDYDELTIYLKTDEFPE